MRNLQSSIKAKERDAKNEEMRIKQAQDKVQATDERAAKMTEEKERRLEERRKASVDRLE